MDHAPPLLFDQSVVQTYSGKSRLRGLDIARRTFVFACVQDIANISLAPNPKTPSVHNILEGLKVRSTVDLLRDSYSATMQSVDDPDPQVVKALRAITAQREAQRRREFDQRLGQAEARWATLAPTRELANVKTYRDKVAAHVDVSFRDGQYVLFDAADLGLKWKDRRPNTSRRSRSGSRQPLPNWNWTNAMLGVCWAAQAGMTVVNEIGGSNRAD